MPPTVQPVKLWIVHHRHRHGDDLLPFVGDLKPDPNEIAASDPETYEIERDDEWLEVHGPYWLDPGDTSAPGSKLRLGEVRLPGYVVDLDNPAMVARAREALFDDISEWVRGDYLYDLIADHESAPLDASNIPTFLVNDADGEDAES